MTRCKERAKDACRNDLFQRLCLLRPERGRLARMMAYEEPLTLADNGWAIRGMQSLITRDFAVLYREASGLLALQHARSAVAYNLSPSPARNYRVFGAHPAGVAAPLMVGAEWGGFGLLRGSAHVCRI